MNLVNRLRSFLLGQVCFFLFLIPSLLFSQETSTVRFASPLQVVYEDHGLLEVTILREGNLLIPAEVDFRIAGRSAIPGQDFIGANERVRFDSQEASKKIIITIVNDTAPEPDEEFDLFLENPFLATASAPSQSKVRIKDRLTAVQFRAANYDVRESHGGVVIGVQREGNLEGTTRVDYQTEDGTGEAGLDYLARSGFLVFKPGERYK